jgi:hypothetical protein
MLAVEVGSRESHEGTTFSAKLLSGVGMGVERGQT